MENDFASNRSSERKAEGILHDAIQQTDLVFGPLGAVCVSIMQGSTNCRDAAKGLIRSGDPTDRQEKEIYLFFEFIYFFMHCTLRLAFGRIDRSKLALLQNFLLTMIPPSAIDSYFSHLPKNSKNDLIDEFVEILDQSEVDYGTCSPDGEWAPILALLTKKLAEVLGIANAEEGALRKILLTAIHELKGMQLSKHIDEFGRNKMSEEDEMRTAERLNQFRLSTR